MKFNKKLFCVTHYQPSHCLPAHIILYNYERSKQCFSSIRYHLFFNNLTHSERKYNKKLGNKIFHSTPSVKCRISKHDIIKVLVKIDKHDFLSDLDFKITKNGSISFSSSMTFMVPLSWRYVRVIVFGHIYLNNTVNIRISILDPTTWQDGKDILIMCPIATDSTPKGVRFFSQ